MAMIRALHTDPTSSFTWIDCSNPTHEELAELGSQHGLHIGQIQQCLDPIHLPKHERSSDSSFMILRVFDDSAKGPRANLRGLTRKLAMFRKEGLLVTIHRKDLDLIEEIAANASGRDQFWVVAELIEATLESYRKPLEEIENAIDLAEGTLFSKSPGSQRALKRIHTHKRKVTVIKRVMLHTAETIRQMDHPSETASPLSAFLRENALAMYLLADELLDDFNSLLSVQLALASHQTNEVVRLLTLFSVFFMPLTFIVGIYGMNFEYMPELRWQYGYAGAWGSMGVVTLGIWAWFRRRGWLR